jgi:hypothetical protein
MVLLTDATRPMLTREVPDLVEVDTREVRGRRAPVRLWSIATAAAQASERRPAAAGHGASGGHGARPRAQGGRSPSPRLL